MALALESAVCFGRVEVHLFLCVSSRSAENLRRHLGKDGIWPGGFGEA